MTTLSMQRSPAAAMLPISRAIWSSLFPCLKRYKMFKSQKKLSKRSYLDILGSTLWCSWWPSWCSWWPSWWSWWISKGSSPKSLALGKPRLPPTKGKTLARLRPSRGERRRFSLWFPCCCWVCFKNLLLRTASLAEVGISLCRWVGPPAPEAKWHEHNTTRDTYIRVGWA